MSFRSNQRILVMASKEVGYECLKYLLEEEGAVALVFCEPEDTALITMLELAGVDYQTFPEALDFLAAQADNGFDVLLNLWSSRILGEEHLRKAKLKVNLHPSYIPYCLGSDTATWSLLDQAPPGVSLLDMNEKVDEGGLYVRRALDIAFPYTAETLQVALKEECVSLFKENWAKIRDGKISASPLDSFVSKHRRKDTIQSRRKTWNGLSATEQDLLRWMMAHEFGSSTMAEIEFPEKIMQIKVSIVEKSSVNENSQ